MYIINKIQLLANSLFENGLLLFFIEFTSPASKIFKQIWVKNQLNALMPREPTPATFEFRPSGKNRIPGRAYYYMETTTLNRFAAAFAKNSFRTAFNNGSNTETKKQ